MIDAGFLLIIALLTWGCQQAQAERTYWRRRFMDLADCAARQGCEPPPKWVDDGGLRDAIRDLGVHATNLTRENVDLKRELGR